MKASRHNKVLGLAIGDKSILIAEISNTLERPEAKRLAEFDYPQGSTLSDPAALGAALGAYLREQKYSARRAVVGLPAKWLLVKTKELPPSDSSVAADLLRLQAEGDFSSELRDLVFDYVGQPNSSAASNVLLVATQQKYIDLTRQLCDAANLELSVITSSAAALGAVTGRAGISNPVILSLTAGGAELTAQSGEHTSTLRHLRAPAPEAQFLSELRRAVSMLPSNGSSNRELIVWDGAGLQSPALGSTVGMQIRNGDLPSLGVSTSEAARNGGGRKFAAAVALGVVGLNNRSVPLDFLHSRLAPPKERLVARWMVWTGVVALTLLIVGVVAYRAQQKQVAELDDLNATNKQMKPSREAAEEFVSKVTMAQHWHGGDPRYLACMNELTRLVPDDRETYCTNLSIHEKEVTRVDPQKPSSSKANSDDQALTITFIAKAPSQAAALQLQGAFLRDKARFSDMKLISITTTGNRGEVTINFSCTYTPLKKTAS